MDKFYKPYTQKWKYLGDKTFKTVLPSKLEYGPTWLSSAKVISGRSISNSEGFLVG